MKWNYRTVVCQLLSAVAHTVKLMAEAPAAQAAAAAAVAVVGPLLPLSVVAAEATAEAAP